MPEFRKCIIALAGVTLFAGLASAQVGTPGGAPLGTAFTCGTTNGSVTPTLRAEGYTELTGDMVIVCSGGSAPALGTVIPTANFTIFLNTAVTSRLLQTTTAGNASEALLLIDEPGSAVAGYGPTVPQTLCSTPAQGAGGVGGCTEWVGNTATGTGVPVSVNPNTGTGTPPAFNPAPVAPGANIFQGVVSGNSVTFFGVPVLPPVTAGLTRVFRITNIRANANQLTSGGPTPGTVQASISINSSTSLIITNSQLTTGFVQQGLSATNTLLRNASNTGNASGSGTTFNQCSSASVVTNVGLLQYQENFATAFKTRYTNGVVQNIPGTIYNSESGFYLAAASFTSPGFTSTYSAGQADYGTRLKATFSNVPSGVSLYVSTRDVVNSFTSPTGSPAAQLVVSEGALDSPSQPGPNTLPLATQTGVFTSGSNTVGYAPVVTSNGTGAAVWEIVTSTPSQIQTVSFSVFISYTANPANNSPAAPGTISVTMSFAPTPSGGLFTSTSGAVASNSLPLPRFSDSLDITKNLANFALCTTALLYPYVVNTAGFDTGLAIANTTTDPFGTTPQVGTCTLNFYGSSGPAAAFVTPSVATGTVYANLASTLAPGFSGYIIAVCNFQYAHGFAFVSDVGARNLAMGYLALIINNGTVNARGPQGETLGN
ncbi:MAG: hypothetical protein WBY44_22725 [Bryobacteraceae bacterium]